MDKVGRPSSLTSLAYENLHSAILTGEFAVGEKLSVVALADRLGMSRSPLRAAVERLATEGLVRVAADGVEVVELGDDDLFNLLVLRSVLEGLASRLAADRVDDDLVARLTELHGRFSSAVARDDTQLARQVDLEFHQALQQHSGNSWLMEDLRRVQSRVIVATYTTAWTARQHEAVEEHAMILQAVRLGQASEAERAAITHIENLIGRIRDSRMAARSETAS